jgi:hypothetical protein
MTLEPNLYSMLMSFAKKNRTPTIDIEPFIEFLERYATYNVRDKPEWARWSKDTSIRVWEELTRLIAEEKCQVLNNDGVSRIYMLQFFMELLEQSYEFPDDTAKLPFPNEQTLKITIPPEQLRPLDITDDLPAYLDNPQTAPLPIIRFKFPRNVPGVLILAHMIPHRLMEAAMLKLRHYLQNHENKEYIQRRLLPNHQGKETLLRELLSMVLIRPFDCITNIETGGDSSYFFWACFCNIVKSDAARKEEFLPEEIAVTQSAYIIEIVNSYYRSRAAKQKEVELSFKALEVQLEKPPYAYTLDTIIKFTNSSGLPLLGQYSRYQLDSWLKQRTTETGDKKMPELLIVNGSGDTQWYIRKGNFFPFAAKLIADTQPKVKLAISDRWKRILREYRIESAMEYDEIFDKLVKKLTADLSPDLVEVLKDPKLFLVFDELMQSHEVIPEHYKIFSHGVLLPLSTLFSFKRRIILADVRFMLPFWYSIPIISALIGFFKNLKKKKDGREGWEEEKHSEAKTMSGSGKDQDVQSAARQMASELTPQGYTIDNYLKELQENWSMLIDKNGRTDFIADVNALIRDRLREFMKTKHEGITSSLLNKIANATIDENKALKGLPDRESLYHYVRLYILKSIIHKKF